MFSSSFSGGFISLCSYAKLNYCNVSQYYVIVTATNSALSSTSKLNIFLRKINVAPSFTPAVYSGSVNEKCQSVSDLLLNFLLKSLFSQIYEESIGIDKPT